MVCFFLILKCLKIQMNKISILEIGFGTGLNAILTLLNSEQLKATVLTILELKLIPVSSRRIEISLNYTEALEIKNNSFEAISISLIGNRHVNISEQFRLTKQQKVF